MFPRGSKSVYIPKNAEFRGKFISTVYITQNQNNSICCFLNQQSYFTKVPCQSKIKIKHGITIEPIFKREQRQLASRLNAQTLSYAKGLNLLPTCDQWVINISSSKLHCIVILKGGTPKGFLYVWVFVRVNVSVCVCVSVWECVCECENVCASVSTPLCVYVCVDVSMCVYICEWVHVWVSASVYVCVCVCMCVCMCVCVCWCVCLCVPAICLSTCLIIHSRMKFVFFELKNVIKKSLKIMSKFNPLRFSSISSGKSSRYERDPISSAKQKNR